MVGRDQKPRIVFFGSGPVAAQSLQLLLNDFEVVAVVTKPKPPHHKGAFPVIELATQAKIPTHTVRNKSDLSALIETNPFQTEVGILIDFGIIVGQDVIDYFPLGIINSHFSVLPEWRGADPITFAVLSGQKSTGVSLMVLVEAMDEGPLIAFGEYDMPKGITTPALTDHLIRFSHQLLVNEMSKYLLTRKPAPQSITGRSVTYSRKLTKQDGVISWDKPAIQLEREVRAYLGWPGSRTIIADTDVSITKAHSEPSTPVNSKPGDISPVREAGLIMVATSDGSLCIEKLKPAGKNEMSAKAFINGHQRLLK